MHHYDGDLRLRPTSDGGRHLPVPSELRPQVRVGAETFDVLIDLLDKDELPPGESASVGISFLSPELVYPLIRIGDAYALFEGGKEIGTVTVHGDVWQEPERIVQAGKDYAATVTKVGWTAAQLTFENGWTAAIHSRDVGLVPWAEIGEALAEGQHLRVRVEAVDPIARTVKLALAEATRSGG